jgi:hypothetical protein
MEGEPSTSEYQESSFFDDDSREEAELEKPFMLKKQLCSFRSRV